MVVLIVTAVPLLLAGGATAAATGAAASRATATITGATAAATGAVATGATAAAGSATTAVVTGTVATTTAAAGGSTGAAIGVTAGGTGIVIAFSAHVAMTVIGAEISMTSISWDCWKPVVHDESEEASVGMTLEELSKHYNVEKIFINEQGQMIVINKFGESFELVPVQLPDRGLALHAQLILF